MNFENMSDEDTRKSFVKTILNVSSDYKMENWFEKQISIDKRLESRISAGSSRQSVTTTRIESKHADSNTNFETMWPTMEKKSTQQCSGDNSRKTGKNEPSVISENVQRIVTPMEQENTKSTDEAAQIKIDSKTPLKDVFNIIEEFSSNCKGSDFNRVIVFFNNCCQNQNTNKNANSNSGGQHETVKFVLPNDVQDAMKTSQAANASESCQEKGSNCSVSSTCQQESKSIQTSEERGEVKQLNTLCTNCTPLSQQPSTSRCCFSSENSATHVQQRLCLECSRRKEIPDAIKYCFDCRRSFYTKSDPPKTTIAAGVKTMEMFTKMERSSEEANDEKRSTDNSDNSGISLPDEFTKLVSRVLQSNRNFNFSLAELKKIGSAILQVSASSDNQSTSAIPMTSNEKIASSSELRNESSTSSVGSPGTTTSVILLPLLVRSSSLRPNFETILEENERNVSFESVAVVEKKISQESSVKSRSRNSVNRNTCSKTDTTAVRPNPEILSVTVSSDSEPSATGLSTTQAGSVVSEVVRPTRKSSLITNKTVKTGPKKRVSLRLDDNDIHILENFNSSETSDNSVFQERSSLIKSKHHGYSDISNVFDNMVAKNVKPMKKSPKVSKLSKEDLLGHLNNIYSALYTDEVTDQVSESVSIISSQMNLSSKKVKEEIISSWIDLCDKNCSAPEKDNCEQPSIFQTIKSKIFFFMNPVRNAETKPGRVGSVSNESGDRDLIKELIIKKFSREIIDYVADPTSSKIKRTASAGASKKVPLPRRKKSIV